jgi:hypothetical protein
MPRYTLMGLLVVEDNVWKPDFVARNSDDGNVAKV